MVNCEWWCLRLPLQRSGVSLASLHGSHMPTRELSEGERLKELRDNFLLC